MLWLRIYIKCTVTADYDKNKGANYRNTNEIVKIIFTDFFINKIYLRKILDSQRRYPKIPRNTFGLQRILAMTVTVYIV
jgi:hypothetical protein